MIRLVRRLIPVVRSLISLPAGAARMPLASFTLFTLAGSGVWNTLLIGAGAALGGSYDTVARYADVLNYLVYAAITLLVAWLVVRRVKRGRTGASERLQEG